MKKIHIAIMMLAGSGLLCSCGDNNDSSTASAEVKSSPVFDISAPEASVKKMMEGLDIQQQETLMFALAAINDFEKDPNIVSEKINGKNAEEILELWKQNYNPTYSGQNLDEVLKCVPLALRDEFDNMLYRGRDEFKGADIQSMMLCRKYVAYLDSCRKMCEPIWENQYSSYSKVTKYNMCDSFASLLDMHIEMWIEGGESRSYLFSDFKDAFCYFIVNKKYAEMHGKSWKEIISMRVAEGTR